MAKKSLTEELYASNLFGQKEMKERLSKETYKAIKKVIDDGEVIDSSISDEVAAAMLDWAVERGATHYTHWFQPLNGFTAEKHESFISPNKKGGIAMEFKGKMLIKGESDASSFPSGGLRATFEARGYTMWDCTSPAFLKEDKAGVTLCIPTAFISYSTEALDEKTPLLRSQKAISTQAVRIIRLFGEYDCKKVNTTVGAEQEYFLVDKNLYRQRKDLVLCGRTLFGARPPKGQELYDHYYGAIDEKISSFMAELDAECWKLGILSKTKHNEVAPAQYELAPIFTSVNIAADQNQLIMELLKKIADRHGLACLLHEKPFEYINGSGKHNNWSISTDDNQNLLEPGDTPYENMRFLLFLAAIIKAIDENSLLLRFSAASYSNDSRLGGYEAPPAIISVYLGDDIEEVLKTVATSAVQPKETGRREIEFGVPTLPNVYADRSDRNRTSPFAFTGNKFEFRMPGSSQSISFVNTVLNTIVASVLDEFAVRLENCSDFDAEVISIIKEVYLKNARIIFNGNGYSDDWIETALKRGLSDVRDTVLAAESLLCDATRDIFKRYSVYSNEELQARYDINIDIYFKKAVIESRVMIEMAQSEILPSIVAYQKSVYDIIKNNSSIGIDCEMQKKQYSEINECYSNICNEIAALNNIIQTIEDAKKDIEKATIARDSLIPAQKKLRSSYDLLEGKIPTAMLPFPTYNQLLYNTLIKQ